MEYRLGLWFTSFSATDKSTDHGGNEQFHYGISEMQGWRFCEFRHSPRAVVFCGARTLPDAVCGGQSDLLSGEPDIL